MLRLRRMLRAGVLGGGGVAPAPSYTFPEGTLFGGVERLTEDGDYAVACGAAGEELPVEFLNNAGDVTISANTNWGSATADQRLLAVRVRGNLTINAGATLTAAARKLGLLVFVDGNVTVNGTLDMSARGANHSATGSNVSAFNVRIYEATDAADNVLPGAGAAGGARQTGTNNGNPGTAGANGQCGGGGGGGCRLGTSANSGAGAAGTAFGGGGGGGGEHGTSGVAQDAAASGGAGGDAAISDKSRAAGGGAGNAGGAAAFDNGSADAGGTGTGGVLIVCAASITIGAAGLVQADGAAGGNAATDGGNGGGGGGSGGGSISLYHTGSYTNGGTVQADGGAGGTASTPGGAGGAGSIREVTLS